MEDGNEIRKLLDSVDFDYKPFEDVREHLHQYPDLSSKEASTARTVTDCLKKIGIRADDIHEHVGGYGTTAVISGASTQANDNNAQQRTLLLRADYDALPLREKTSLPFASSRTQEDTAGTLQPVMHACGHDIHAAALLGAGAKLLQLRAHWAGRVVLLFQPAEENSTGAQAMLDDGLYMRGLVPIPDVVLGQHVSPLRAGSVGLRAGELLSASASFEITFFGRGGHGAMRFVTCDPVVMVASAVVRLQSIVAREVDTATDMAVVTVGSFHAGATENVIPDEAVIRVNIRAYREAVLARLVAAVKRIVIAEAAASGAPREPALRQIAAFPGTVNDAAVVRKLSGVFAGVFAKQGFNPNTPKHTASDDFSRLATAVDRPYAFWSFGGTDPDLWDRAQAEGTLDSIPKDHQATFAPVTQPTLKTGIDAWCAAVLAYLGSGG